MTNLPDRPRAEELPERRITTAQFEQVIRRAAELQARSLESPDADAMSETEVLRIAREIGISPAHVRRALAETGSPEHPATLGERVFGPGWVSASRAVPGDPEAVQRRLDEYMVRRERLAPVRRFADRTLYERARGMDLARVLEWGEEMLSGSSQPMVGAGFKLRDARGVELEVRPLEEGFSYVTISVDLGSHRATAAGVGTVAGGGIGMAVATVLAIAVDPAAAVLGAPILAGGLWSGRAFQLRTAARAGLHVEAILDAVERGEQLVRTRPGRR